MCNTAYKKVQAIATASDNKLVKLEAVSLL
jgi:hypothetical protein